MKVLILIRMLLVILTIGFVFCQQETDKTKVVASNGVSKSVVKVDSTVLGTFATAQIALNVVTHSGKSLAFTSLALYALVNNKNHYKIHSLLVNDTEKGPFNGLNIVDKAVITSNGVIKVLISYSLQTQRLNWETEKGQLTGQVGEQPFKESVQNEGGSLNGTATLVFDEKSLRLLSQVSELNEKVDNVPTNGASNYLSWQKFALKYLKPQLVTTINWTNAGCQASACTTGEMREQK